MGGKGKIRARLGYTQWPGNSQLVLKISADMPAFSPSFKPSGRSGSIQAGVSAKICKLHPEVL